MRSEMIVGKEELYLAEFKNECVRAWGIDWKRVRERIVGMALGFVELLIVGELEFLFRNRRIECVISDLRVRCEQIILIQTNKHIDACTCSKEEASMRSELSLERGINYRFIKSNTYRLVNDSIGRFIWLS